MVSWNWLVLYTLLGNLPRFEESPGRVRNVVVTPLSSVEISVKWREPKISVGVISLYKVYYHIVNDDKEANVDNNVEVQGNTTSTVLRDLKKYTQYNVTVIAVTVSSGVSTYKEIGIPVTAKTLEDAPSAPVNVSVTSIPRKPHQLLVTWTRPLYPNGIIREFMINYRKIGEDRYLRKVLVISGTSKRVILEDLEPFTKYLVSVQAYTIKGGVTSNMTVGRTEEGKPSPPISLTSINITHISAVLKWSPPKSPRGYITKYKIQYSGNKSFIEDGEHQEDSVNKTIILNHPEDLQLAIPDLIPDTNFTFIVVAFTSIGPGERSVLRVKTDIDWPVKPKLPTNNGHLRVTSLGVEVKLAQPSNRNGAITHVDLLLVKLTSGTNLFHGSPVNYTTSLLGNLLYIAARFKYKEIPSSFTIGDRKWYGGYFNGPLQKDFPYSYALRSYSTTKTNRVLYSTSTNIYFYSGSKEDDSRSQGTTIIIGIVAVIGAVIVCLLIIVTVKRGNKERGVMAAKSMSTKGQDPEVQENEGNKDTNSVEQPITNNSLCVQSTGFAAPKDTVASTLQPADPFADHLYVTMKMALKAQTSSSEATRSEIGNCENETPLDTKCQDSEGQKTEGIKGTNLSTEHPIITSSSYIQNTPLPAPIVITVDPPAEFPDNFYETLKMSAIPSEISAGTAKKEALANV